jgi:hypothetical protein
VSRPSPKKWTYVRHALFLCDLEERVEVSVWVGSAVGDLGGQVSRRRERDVERTHEIYEMEPTVPVFRVLQASEV